MVDEKTPFTKKYFQKRQGAVSSPVDLMPKDMLDIRSKEMGDGRLYRLSFLQTVAFCETETLQIPVCFRQACMTLAGTCW